MSTPLAPLFKLGITGTMASGKSLVGQYLTDLGVPVIDTDQVVADLYRDDTALRSELVDTFSRSILDKDGRISKPALAAQVFADPQKLKRLEGLVHPRVRAVVDTFCNNRALAASPVRAVLVPLLFEGGTGGYYDAVWCVVVNPLSALMARLHARNPAMTDAEAHARLNRQWSQAEKSAASTRVIDNSETPEATRTQVQEALSALTETRHAPHA